LRHPLTGLAADDLTDVDCRSLSRQKINKLVPDYYADSDVVRAVAEEEMMKTARKKVEIEFAAAVLGQKV